MAGKVTAVNLSRTHSFHKSNRESIDLLAGLGIAGDAHCGKTVQHRSRVAKDPTQPNLRQVHLIHGELHDELKTKGFDILPGQRLLRRKTTEPALTVGQIGENITTMGIELLKLPTDTLLHIGRATIQITGLRNPCAQLDRFRSGLMAAVLDKDSQGNLIRKAGIMGIVIAGGVVSTGDKIYVELPPQPHRSLERV